MLRGTFPQRLPIPEIRSDHKVLPVDKGSCPDRNHAGGIAVSGGLPVVPVVKTGHQVKFNRWLVSLKIAQTLPERRT